MPYIHRLIEPEVQIGLETSPVVALLGPRQCGKSTLAKQILKATDKPSRYLDLENPEDMDMLTNPMLFLRQNQDKLICFDEIQRFPEFFSILRSVIDSQDRNGQFLLLGSASRDLIRQSSETLAGRIHYLELGPFNLPELEPGINPFLVLERGGFPRSYLASSAEASYKWRQSFITTFLERDLGLLGFRYPPETMRRLWQMLAHSHGQMLNMSKLGESLGLSHTTVRNYLDLLSATFMIRLLPPYQVGTSKRLVKTPRFYMRDSGILLTLLRIKSMDDLFGNPSFGAIWEGFVTETLISSLHPDEVYYYRTLAGAEIDLILEIGNKRFAVECKLNSRPGVKKGFFESMNEIGIPQGLVVSPVSNSYPLKDNVMVCNPAEAIDWIRNSL